MGIRQAMNENPGITTGVTIGVIVLAIVFIIWQIAGGGGSGSQAPTNLKWFSDDDGKTFYADDANNIPPYTNKRGKTAYIAIVYQCGSGKPFVNRLQRFNAEGKKKAEEQMKTNPAARISMAFSMQYIEFKLPGPGHRWVKMGSPEGADMTVKCPDGTDNNIQLLEPTEKDRLK